jgi:crotonobetainyl-CoA:carnitine CoA-transferase CaiB-like acyl-CoA transferase
MRAGVAISDTSAGMFLGQGILLALLHRERTGQGQWVHTSLLESMMSKLDFQGARYTMSGEIPDQQGNDHPTQVPMGTFNASDGYVNIAAFGDQMWRRFCDALGAEALFSNPDYASIGLRIRNKIQVKADMNLLTQQYGVTDLVDRLNYAGVPCGPINTIADAFEDRQVKYLEMSVTAAHPQMGDLGLVRSPINLSAFPHPSKLDGGAPDPGIDSRSVLQTMGISDQEIKVLKEQGIIGG